MLIKHFFSQFPKALSLNEIDNSGKIISKYLAYVASLAYYLQLWGVIAAQWRLTNTFFWKGGGRGGGRGEGEGGWGEGGQVFIFIPDMCTFLVQYRYRYLLQVIFYFVYKLFR
jgi:hypothetical protein